MTNKITPTNEEREWLVSHGFKCEEEEKDNRAWSYHRDDGLIVSLFLENRVDDRHEWMLSWYFDFNNGSSLMNDDILGFASPEDAVAAVVSAVSRFDAAGKFLHAAVAALTGKEAQDETRQA